MTAPLRPTLTLAACSLEPISLGALVERSLAFVQQGARMIALFGRPSAEERVIVSAILLLPERGLTLLRAEAARGEHYPALSAQFPAAHMFERELWEQTGLVPTGHPWLKPVRFEGALQGTMADYPFFVLEGKQVHEVAVGPVHAGVIEPGHFRFMCLGEQVHHLEIQLGYQHRGVEERLLARAPLQLTPLVESIAGDSAVAHAWAHCAALEALAQRPVSYSVEVVRGVALELERIAIHLAGLAGLCGDIAFLQGAATYGRLRTAVINASMRLCGSRFGRGWLRPGGVTAGISKDQRQDLHATLLAFLRDLRQVNALVLSARSVRSRFAGIGALSRAAVEDLGLVGFVARSAGVARNVRLSLPGDLWQALPIDASLEPGGDCWARLCLRMGEIEASARWLARALEDPGLEQDTPLLTPLGALPPQALCVSLCEGVRGEVVHVLETDHGGKLLHYKVQDPSLLNWFGLALALRGAEISDFPICNKSFDLSYCGNDL